MEKGKKNSKATYTQEFRDSMVKKMLPPESIPVAELSNETGISKAALHAWKTKAAAGGNVISTSKHSEKYSSKEKFLIVLESYSMNESALAAYCRTKGLYVEQIKQWRDICASANANSEKSSKDLRTELHIEKSKVKDLEKDLNRKEKALAETAALLVLRKKLHAIWGDPEGE
jgi:transposase-like protein